MKLPWARIGTAIFGLGAIAVAVMVPPLAPAMVPLVGAGAGAIGLAIRWPGDTSVAKAAEQLAPAIGQAAAEAATAAAIRNAGKPAAELGRAVGLAAITAAAKALDPPPPGP